MLRKAWNFLYMNAAAVLNRHKTTLFLLLITFVGYWQLAFMQDLLKWDNIEAYHPYRYIIGECIRNHEFPFWNPYQYLGYPIHSDPESGAWYPVVWLISLIMPYDFAAMNVEFLFHIFMAGCGMVAMSKNVGISDKIALATATLYMFTGFMVETGQIITFTIGLAWTPFVIVSFLNLIKNRGIKDVVLLSFFMSLLITGGYPAFTIIVFYILLLTTLYHLIRLIKCNEYRRIKQIIYKIVAAAMIALAASSGYLYAILKALPHFTRGTSLEYSEIVYSYSMTIDSLLSMLTPVSNSFSEQFSGNDFVFAYIGFFTLPLLLTFIFIKKNLVQKVIFFCGLFFIAASFGKDLPIRHWLYITLPGMNLFRHPVIFYAFAQSCFMLNAAFALQWICSNYQHLKRKLLLALLLMLVGLFILALVIFQYIPQESTSFFSLFIHDFLVATDLPEVGKAFTHLCMLTLLVVVLVTMVLRSTSAKTFSLTIVTFILLDAFIALQLNMDEKVLLNHPLKSAEQGLQKLPKGFPLPDTGIKMNQVNDRMHDFPIPKVWKNLNSYTKRTAHDGYASFILNNFSELRESPLIASSLDHPIVFLTDKCSPISSLSSKREELNKDVLYLNDDDHARSQNWTMKSNDDDKLQIVSYVPQELILETKSQHDQLLTFVQNDYQGWEVFMDEKPVQHFTANFSLITVFLPAGDHQVRFSFSDPTAEGLFILSSIMMVLLLAVMIYYSLGEVKLKRIVLLFLVMIGGIILLFMQNVPFNEVQKNDYLKMRSSIDQFQQKNKEPAEVVLNLDDPLSFDPERSEEFRYIRFKESSLFRLDKLQQVVSDAPQEFFIYAFYNLYNPNEAIEIIREKYSEVVHEISFNKGKMFIFKKSAKQKRENFKEWVNDFEQPHEKWYHNTNLIDTSTFYSGEKGIKLDSLKEYGPVFTLKRGMDFENLDLLNLSAKFLLSSEDNKLCFVFIVEKENGQSLWKPMNLVPDQSLKEGWQEAHWSIDITELVGPNDVIKSYVWNIGKKELFIDDVKVSLTTNLNH